MYDQPIKIVSSKKWKEHFKPMTKKEWKRYFNSFYNK